MRRAIAFIALFIGLDYGITAFFIYTKDWFYETNPLLNELFTSAGLSLGVTIAFVGALTIKSGLLYAIHQLLAIKFRTDTRIFSQLLATSTLVLSASHIYAVPYNLVLGIYRCQLPNPYDTGIPILV